MRLSFSVIFFGLVAAVHAGVFVQDGQEYEYQSSIISAAGTMDVATHSSGEMYRMKVRIQVSGMTLNVAISDMEKTMYVGGHLPTDIPYSQTKFTKVGDVSIKFSINLDNDGKFQSLTMPSGLTVFQKNLVKGWAAQLQVNSGEIKKGNLAFKSTEQTLHGECDISYTVTDDMVYKTVAHMKDCRNRRYRFIDDWRGFRCNMDWTNPERKTDTDGLFSHSTTAYKIDKSSGTPVIKAMITNGALVAQMFETEGQSHMAFVNVTSILVGQRASSGDISVSGETQNSLAYEFADSSYKWNEDRDLKAREPFLSAGEYYEDSQASLKSVMLKGLDVIMQSLHAHDNDDETIQRNHKHGLQSLYFVIYAMDYDTLKSTAEELLADKSDLGVHKSNLFNEYLGNAGTTAAALVVRDLILENKFDTERDAGRILTAVAFHIRRPNTQLVREYEKLLSYTGGERFLQMSIPLAFGHLVKVTCMRAGNAGGPEQRECWQSFASKYVSDFWQKFKDSDDRDTKHLMLSTMQNIRFGGQSMKVKDLVQGKMADESSEFRSAAIWVAGWEAAVREGVDYFFPVFANRKEDHEVRISALVMIFYSKPSATDLARVLAVLKGELNYEVINFAYTLFEQFANTINPCHEETSELAKFFLKYMAQYSRYETDWGFGVSKTMVREYQKKKYGYGGATHLYSVGSTVSTTPLSIGFGFSNTFFHNYQAQGLHVHLRVEGLAKGIIRKFKSMDPTTWKTADLENILSNVMGIRARADQPVRVHVSIQIKGAIVFSRSYDDSDAAEGGKLATFMEGLSDMGDTYSINHQRMVQLGAALYEQPSEIGLPIAYMDSTTVSASLEATIKRGNHRGLIYRNVDYDINVLSNAHQGMMIVNPGRKVTYAIFQSRIYHVHVPRKLVIGLNPIRKELKLSISRPEYDDPALILMHSQHTVTVKGKTLGDQVPELKDACPECEQRVVVSRGPGAAQTRVIRDFENEKDGYYAHSEYFDCEMDVSETNARGRAVLAFMPYNKNPQTPGSVIYLGVRQIMAFLTFYPRVEKCGVFSRWSQSKNNPVTDIEVSLRVQADENGERMFFRGRKTLIKAIVKANGQPETRAYRISLSLESTPGNIYNKAKLQINRAPVAGLGITPYTLCMAYEAKFPDFNKEFLAVDFNEKLAVSGKAMVQYGEGTECEQGDGEIRVNFQHETTTEANKALETKWYYNKCMEAKNSPEWRERGGTKLPATDACYMTLWDATSARHYTWQIQFVKLTNRMKNIIGKVRNVIQAGMLPYWDVDPDDVNGDDTGPFMNIDATFKNGDKSLDFKMETSQGTNEFKDYPLNLEWTNRLRNLKLTGTIKRLIDMKIISPCVATIGSVRTNDNVTYAYNAGSCWTLTSGHCGPTPSYAVFSKKVGNKLAVKAFFGGHVVDVDPSGSVSINGAAVALEDGEEETHSSNNQEIFKIFKWGSTVNIYSFLKVWMATDNTFVEVMPAPSVRGQHCGLCGNFNRNKYDEWTGKDGKTIVGSADAMVEEWKWQC